MARKIKTNSKKSVNAKKKTNSKKSISKKNNVSTKKGANTEKTPVRQGKKNIAKEIIVFLSYLLIPSILVSLSTRVFPLNNQVWLSFVYITTLIGIILFFVFKFHHHKVKILALLLGLASSPLYTYIHEARTIAFAARARESHGEDFTLLLDLLPYFTTILSVLYYALPFLFISGITLIVTLTIKTRKNIS